MSSVMREVFAKFGRIAIVGGPRAGKTTALSHSDGRYALSTDKYLDEGVGWGDIPDAIVTELSSGGPQPREMLVSDLDEVEPPRGGRSEWRGGPQPRERWVVEGVQVARALRKGLQVDAVVYLRGTTQVLTPGQESMRKAVHTVFCDWRSGAIGARSIPVYWVLD